MTKNKYIPTIGSLYVNYVFQGIAAIIISQNMSVLIENWDASFKEVSLVLSAIGMGRILSVNFAGVLSDKLGRRQSILLGIFSYIVFFIGIPFSPNYIWAFVFAIFAGFGNAFLDTGTYPVVIEAFENSSRNSTLSVLNKAFISIGQLIFPIVTRFTLQNDYYFGWPFIVSAIFMVLNLLLTCHLPFPTVQNENVAEKNEENLDERKVTNAKETGANFKIEGIALLVFSFVSVSLFNIFITWIPSFAQDVLQMNEADSLVLVSYYSIFSFISVFVTSFIVKQGIHIPKFIIFCTSITGLSLTVMLLYPSFLTVMLANFCIGFFAAGGIWQLGLIILLEFFPFKRGVITSFYSLATSVSVMGIPYLTGILAEQNMYYVFVLNAGLAFLGAICLVPVYKRYQIIFNK